MPLLKVIVLLTLITLIPALELRASIPFGIFGNERWGIPPGVLGWPGVVLVCVASNIVLGWVVFLVMGPAMRLLDRFPWFARQAEPWLERARRKLHPYVEKYGTIGVALFIGVPLPGSGVYTGAVGSYLIGMSRRNFAVANVLGVVIAGAAVTAVRTGNPVAGMGDQAMNPIAFRIGALSIHWYGILVASGFLAAVGMMQWNRRHAGMTADQVADMTFFTLLGGILGARSWYVIEFWGEYRDRPLDIIMIQKGGLVYYGGFLLAVLMILWFCRRRKLSPARVCDLGAVGLAVGHAVGRIGCFMQGCCHGRPASGGLSFQYPRIGYVVDAEGHLLNPLLAQPVYPVQLLESAGNVLLAVGLYFALRRLRPGRTAALYIIAYGTLRFCLEFFRGDHRDRILDLFTPALFFGLVLVPVGIVLWLILSYCDRKTIKAPPYP